MKGRKRDKLPSNYQEVVRRYYDKEISVNEALNELKFSRYKFYKYLNEENKVRKNKIKSLNKKRKYDISKIVEEMNVSKKTIYNHLQKGRTKYLVEFNDEKECFKSLKEIANKYEINPRTIRRHLEGKKTKLDKKGIRIKKK